MDLSVQKNNFTIFLSIYITKTILVTTASLEKSCSSNITVIKNKKMTKEYRESLTLINVENCLIWTKQCNILLKAKKKNV